MGLKKLIILLAIGFPFMAYPQDTITYLNGKTQVVKITEINPVEDYVSFLPYKKKAKKEYYINLKGLYSIAYKDSICLITYEQDSSDRLGLTREEMGFYIRGEQFALKHYKAPWVTAGGVLAGAAGGFFLRAYFGILVPTTYCGITGLSGINVKKLKQQHPELFSNDNFTEGYKAQARHKKVKNAIFGGLAGLGVGLIGYGIFSLAR